MKITKILALAAMMAGAAAPAAMAQDDTVTITVSQETGALTCNSATSTWNNVWTSNARPGVMVSCEKNNMAWSGSALDMRSGQALSATYSVTSTSGSYFVSSYSFNYVNATAGSNQTLTVGGEATTTSDQSQKLEVTGIVEGTTSSFTLAGPNSGILVTDFTVTLTKRVTPDIDFLTTELIDGQFDPETNWYNIQIAAAGFYLANNGDADHIALDKVKTDFSDDQLWCFVGDEDNGYMIYNKGAGPGKLFAAPKTMSGTTGGSAYPVLIEPGNDAYCYVWDFNLTEVLGADNKAFYVNETGEPSKTLNNRSNILAFWTGGKDAGSAVRVTWAQQLINMDGTANGTFANAPNKPSAWMASWTHTASQTGFGTAFNNMQWAGTYNKVYTGIQYGPWSFTTPEGRYVSHVEFDMVKDGSYTETVYVTADGYDNINATGEIQHVEFDFAEADGSAFYVSADPSDANKGIQMSNMKYIVRRGEGVNRNVMIFNYGGDAAHNIVYRIPAIATVQAGEHAGRIIAVNDYRYGGGDIGAGRIDLYMSVSDDNGATWTEPDHFRDADNNPIAQGDGSASALCAFGDAAIVSDRDSGKLLMIAVGGHRNFFASRRAAPNYCFRWYSEDAGATWTREDITEQILSMFDGEPVFGKIDGQFFGSGRIMQSSRVKVGEYYRLYAALSSQNNGGNTRNWTLYSDDFGKTWNILGGVPCVSSNGDEPKTEELPDGSVLLAARGNGGNRNFNIFRYTDIAKAEGDWSSTINTNMGMGGINACNGEIMILPVANKETGKQAYMALQSFPYGGSRANVSIAWKLLDTAEAIAAPAAFSTWNGRIQITKLGSAYSTMTFQKDNRIGFLFEEETYGKAYCGQYRSLSIEEITDSAYIFAPDVDGAFAADLTKALVNYRIESVSEPGQYVGQPTGVISDEAQAAADAFLANPTDENYTAFNKAIAEGTGVIEIKHNGIYTLKSAHNGTYTFGDRYLTSDGTNLISVSDATEETRFVFSHKSDDSEGWLIFHPATKTYLGQSPAATETKFNMTADAAAAHEYSTISTTDGYTAIFDTNPGNATYAAIHQGGNNNGHIVIWTKGAQASQWYMSFEGLYDTVAIEEVNTDVIAPVRYFDITGREVAVPVRGNLYITSDRRKIRF